MSQVHTPITFFTNAHQRQRFVVCILNFRALFSRAPESVGNRETATQEYATNHKEVGSIRQEVAQSFIMNMIKLLMLIQYHHAVVPLHLSYQNKVKLLNVLVYP